MSEVDRIAFERFVAEHGDRLLRAAYGLCGDWQQAEDLVQQALTTLARRWPAVSDSPLGYAYRCLTRANIDRWRALRRRPAVVLLDPHDLAAVGPTSDPAAVEDHLVVLAALRALPRHQRAILVLRYLDDLSEADTAAALGISVGAVKSGAARGLARLRVEQSSRLKEAHRD